MRFNTESPVFQFWGTLADFVLLNFIFLITCIPIITIGPSVSALFTVTMREARGEHGYILRPYLVAWKANFKSSFLLSVFYLIIGSILGFNLIFWIRLKTVPAIAALAIVVLCLILYLFSLLYVFALSARFDNGLRQTIKNSLLLALAHPVQTGLLIIIAAAALTLVYVSSGFRVFLLIFGTAFLAYCESYPLVKVFEKYEKGNIVL